MDALIAPFEHTFMRQALLTGVLVAAATAVVGTWVVLRGLTFLGDALAHGVLPGIAAGFVLGFEPSIGAAASAAVMVGGVGVVRRRTPLGEDVGIGLLFVGMLATGVVIISRAGSFAQDLSSFLFGNILGVQTGDARLAGAVLAVALVATLVLWRPLLALALDEVKAEALGLHPRTAHLVLLGLVAAAVVASYRAVGALLVFGLLVAPPATASLLVRRVPHLMAGAVGLGVAAVYLGLLASFHLDTAAGATISVTSVVGFFVVLAARTAWERWWVPRRLRSRPRTPPRDPDGDAPG